MGVRSLNEVNWFLCSLSSFLFSHWVEVRVRKKERSSTILSIVTCHPHDDDEQAHENRRHCRCCHCCPCYRSTCWVATKENDTTVVTTSSALAAYGTTTVIPPLPRHMRLRLFINHPKEAVKVARAVMNTTQAKVARASRVENVSGNICKWHEHNIISA